MSTQPTAAVVQPIPVFKHRVLIADNSHQKFKKIIEALEENNIEVTFTNEKSNLIATAQEFHPEIILVNLFMDNGSTLGLIREMKKALDKQSVKILVMTAHYSKENIAECVRAGAADFILEPFDPRLLIQRIRYQLQDREFISPDDLRAEPTQVAAGFQLVYECLKILAEVKDNNRSVHEVLKRVADLSKSTRVNAIMGDVETSQGSIIAASDDVNIIDKQVDLEKYPEVREVLLNGSIVYIKDVTANPLTKDIKDNVKTIDISSLLVFPVRHRSETLGTLNIRLGKSSMEVSDKHLKTFYMIALGMGSKMAARRLMKRLEKEKTPA